MSGNDGRSDISGNSFRKIFLLRPVEAARYGLTKKEERQGTAGPKTPDSPGPHEELPPRRGAAPVIAAIASGDDVVAAPLAAPRKRNQMLPRDDGLPVRTFVRVGHAVAAVEAPPVKPAIKGKTLFGASAVVGIAVPGRGLFCGTPGQTLGLVIGPPAGYEFHGRGNVRFAARIPLLDGTTGMMASS